MPEDYYALLGVDPDASEEAILRAYRRKAAEHHPDVSDEPGAEETFRRLNRAKRVLTDERRRREYDRLGHDRFLDRADGERGGSTADDPDRGAAGWPDEFGPDATTGFGSPPSGRRAGPIGAAGDPLFGRWPGRRSVAAVDLESLIERAGRRRTGRGPASRPTEPSSEAEAGTGTEGGARECPRCAGRGTFVHDIDTARGRHRRLEPCERCGGAGTIPA